MTSEIEEQISSTIISKTLKNLKEQPLTNIGCTVGLVDKNNIYKWRCTLMGPSDSPYKGGFFKIFITFPKNFPKEGPEVVFHTPIFHLNVNPVRTQNQLLGHCCVSTINFWKPDTSIEDLLVSLFALFYATNEDSAYLGYGTDIIKEFKENRKAYNERVKYFTAKYASGKYKVTETERWDFTYDVKLEK